MATIVNHPATPRTNRLNQEEELQISMQTLIGCAPILGHNLEDRSDVQQEQNPELLDFWSRASKREISRSASEGFCVAPFDILVEKKSSGTHKFHIIEFNGTGIGGLTNLPNSVIRSVLNSLGGIVNQLKGEHPLILVAISGKEDEHSPRYNKLMHEKILYVDILRKELINRFDKAQVTVCTSSSAEPKIMADCPNVVLGYMKDLLSFLKTNEKGQLLFNGKLVSGVVNDRFFLNVLQKFNYQIDLDQIIVMNRSFYAGADKATAYRAVNDYILRHAPSCFPEFVDFDTAESLLELQVKVSERIKRGMKTVIKPRGTGLGHGIEFFLDQNESEAEILSRITSSVVKTAEFYGLPEGAFPYTVSSFVDTKIIEGDHHLAGHKFEIRIVIFQQDQHLIALPSIAKVSCHAYDAQHLDRSMLINNITASSTKTKQSGKDFMLPLANFETLEILGISPDELADLCSACTGVMAHTLETESQVKIQGLSAPFAPVKQFAGF